jgi:hypothetical protein
MTATLTMPGERLVAEVADGLKLATESVAADERLSLAIDLYAASLWENSSAARVISLSSTLEVLVEPAAVQPFVATHLEAALAFLAQRRDPRTENIEQRSELDRLYSRVADLRNESISRRLRAYVVAHAHALGESEDQVARNIAHAYGTRSSLLHDGHALAKDIQAASVWLSNAVPKLLENRIERVSSTEQ